MQPKAASTGGTSAESELSALGLHRPSQLEWFNQAYEQKILISTYYAGSNGAGRHTADNGGIDIGDAVCIVNHLVDKTNTTFNNKLADLNGNGGIDIGDAVMIVNILVGKTNTPQTTGKGLQTTEEGLQTTDDHEPQ